MASSFISCIRIKHEKREGKKKKTFSIKDDAYFKKKFFITDTTKRAEKQQGEKEKKKNTKRKLFILLPFLQDESARERENKKQCESVYKILCEAVTCFNDVIKNDTSRYMCILLSVKGKKEGRKEKKKGKQVLFYSDNTTGVNDQVDLQFILMSFDQANKS